MSHKNTPGKPLARVLCIDDNCDVLQLEKEILEEAGYEVLLASNGADGLNLATGSMIDIVILDCEMPQMTGTEVAHRIRAMRPMLPIIMVSGAGQPKETKGIVDCFVPKDPGTHDSCTGSQTLLAPLVHFAIALRAI